MGTVCYSVSLTSINISVTGILLGFLWLLHWETKGESTFVDCVSICVNVSLCMNMCLLCTCFSYSLVCVCLTWQTWVAEVSQSGKLFTSQSAIRVDSMLWPETPAGLWVPQRLLRWTLIWTGSKVWLWKCGSWLVLLANFLLTSRLSRSQPDCWSSWTREKENSFACAWPWLWNFP